MDTICDPWLEGEVRVLPLEQIGEHYRRYRLASPEAEEEMFRSMRRWGQLTPIAVWMREGQAEVLDGFKRLSAARRTVGLKCLTAKRLEVDERRAKAAIYGLNKVGNRLAELEEAWIVFALVREDGLSQVEVAGLLGHHKSWVHRRLALLERLCDQGRDDLQLGLLSVTAARQLVRLPPGNQPEVLGVCRRERLSTRELTGTVDLLLASATRQKEEYILADPRRALQQAQGYAVPSWDPRLSAVGNRASKQLGALLDGLSRMENWLRHRGRADLTACDRSVLRPAFEKLGTQCRLTAEHPLDTQDLSIWAQSKSTGAILQTADTPNYCAAHVVMQPVEVRISQGARAGQKLGRRPADGQCLCESAPKTVRSQSPTGRIVVSKKESLSSSRSTSTPLSSSICRNWRTSGLVAPLDNTSPDMLM